jgi:putative serine protease PepD
VAALAAVIGAVVGAGAGVGAFAVLDHHAGSGNTGGVQVSSQAGPVTAPSGSVAAVATQIQPSVVTIDVTGATATGTGSGVLIRNDGYILTNDHVVSLDGTQPAGAAQITVVLSDGNQRSATVVGEDPTDDLAVIKIASAGLQPATFADSSKVVVGQPVVAIGAPLGLSDTVTSGIVSGVDRPVQAGNNGQAIFDAIQTDAAINPGNSGGPLVDLSGHVVGIDSAIASTGGNSDGSSQPGNIGIGFAIPANEATRVANELITRGRATHAAIGVTVAAPADQSSFAPTSGSGATVADVAPGGPADKAGIRPGDVITAVGAQRVDDPVGLIAAVRSHGPGEAIPLKIVRDGKSMTITVTLSAQSG